MVNLRKIVFLLLEERYLIIEFMLPSGKACLESTLGRLFDSMRGSFIYFFIYIKFVLFFFVKIKNSILFRFFSYLY